MALGDGIRRNIATVSKEERDLFIDAVRQLNQNQQLYYPGSRNDFPAGHVSAWFKQDEIHQSSHVHGCPAFLPWHRELCNRFEALLRLIHPELSLHYWDWNFDPSHMPDGNGGFINLFDDKFMGNADGTVNGGAVGEPLLSWGFYKPEPTDDNFRDDRVPIRLKRPDPNDPSTWSYPPHYNPADPPKTLTRNKAPGPPPVGQGDWPNDSDLINAKTWEDFRHLMYGTEKGTSPQGAHGAAHSYIGGNLANSHLSFRDPFVFLLHANIDRLWAMWQLQPDHPERLNSAKIYDDQGSTPGSGNVEFGHPSWGILSPLEPWAGLTAQTPFNPGPPPTGTGIITNLWPIRPWFAPENAQNLPENHKISLSVVIPPSYDTPPHSS